MKVSSLIHVKRQLIFKILFYKSYIYDFIKLKNVSKMVTRERYS